MADIKNKNELKRRIELFMDELDYSINKDYCMETMRMMREFIGHVSHRLDCANSKIKSLMAKLREYQKLEEQGLLLRLPCSVGSTVWLVGNEFVNDYEVRRYIVDETGVDCVQIAKEIDVRDYWNSFSIDDIGKTVFLTKEEAEQALAEMKGE